MSDFFQANSTWVSETPLRVFFTLYAGKKSLFLLLFLLLRALVQAFLAEVHAEAQAHVQVAQVQ